MTDVRRHRPERAARAATGCVECDAAGGWWFHLRRCAQCGHIGCCDSSPAQHATAHCTATGHPVIRSFEPGEDWFWDYSRRRAVRVRARAGPAGQPPGRPARAGPRRAGAGGLGAISAPLTPPGPRSRPPSLVAARLVGGACQDGGVSQTVFSTPFIGREEELARLSGVLERARGGEARAVLRRRGRRRRQDPCAGRGRRAGRAAGMTVLTGHCVDLGDVGLPYLPFTEILGALAADERFAAALAAHPAGRTGCWARAPARRRTTGIRPRRRRRGRLRLFEGMAALLADLSRGRSAAARPGGPALGRPVLPGSAALPAQPGRPAAAARAAPAATGWRCSPRTARTTCTAAIRCARCWRSWCGCPPSTGWSCGRWPTPRWPGWCAPWRSGRCRTPRCARIVERAEGNAFYAEELLAAARRARPAGCPAVWPTSSSSASSNCPTPPSRCCARPPSPGGGSSTTCCGTPSDCRRTSWSRRCARPSAASCWSPGDDDTYAFRHALAREAVYADLLPGRTGPAARGVRPAARRARAVAAETAAERAHHYRESHDLAEALAASLEAADHAQRVGAPAEELRHLEAALDLWAAVDAEAPPSGEGADRVTLMLRASAAAAHAGEAHRAVSLTRVRARRASAGTRTPNSPPGCATRSPAT